MGCWELCEPRLPCSLPTPLSAAGVGVHCCSLRLAVSTRCGRHLPHQVRTGWVSLLFVTAEACHLWLGSLVASRLRSQPITRLTGHGTGSFWRRNLGGHSVCLHACGSPNADCTALDRSRLWLEQVPTVAERKRNIPMEVRTGEISSVSQCPILC